MPFMQQGIWIFHTGSSSSACQLRSAWTLIDVSFSSSSESEAVSSLFTVQNDGSGILSVIPFALVSEAVKITSSLLLSFLVHEERFATLEAVQKTAKEQVSGETQRTTEQTREFTCRCLKLPRKNLDIRCRTVPNFRAGSTLLFCATTNLNGLQVCLGGCRPWKHQSPPSQEQLTSGQRWPSQIL